MWFRFCQRDRIIYLQWLLVTRKEISVLFNKTRLQLYEMKQEKVDISQQVEKKIHDIDILLVFSLSDVSLILCYSIYGAVPCDESPSLTPFSVHSFAWVLEHVQKWRAEWLLNQSLPLCCSQRRIHSGLKKKQAIKTSCALT